MSARSIVYASPIAAVVLVLACAEGRDSTSTDATAGALPVVTIVATDSAYEAPDTVAAGFNAFRIVNHGDQFHAATIVRLDNGRTLPEYIDVYREAQRTRGLRPAWATFRAGPGAAPHSEGNATVHLEPGNYAWVCFVPHTDGVPHLLAHDQAQAFVVRPLSEDISAPSAPALTVSLRLLDYGFEFSAPIEAGRHMIHVENVGVDYHHALLFKLAPGKTMEDLRAWLQKNMQGEAPVTFVGAMAELSPGNDGYLELELSAGEYALVCLIAGRDEVSHVAKGMIHHFRIA